MDELERWARLQGWFLTSHPVGEETWWQWLRIADPDDGRHPVWRSEEHARSWMQGCRDKGQVWPAS